MKDCDEHVFLLFHLLLLKSCWLRLAIFGHLGDMFASFEARNLKRASRSHAKTGLCRRRKNLRKTCVLGFSEDVGRKKHRRK